MWLAIAFILIGAIFGAGFLISLIPFGGDVVVLVGGILGAVIGGYIGYAVFKRVILQKDSMTKHERKNEKCEIKFDEDCDWTKICSKRTIDHCRM